MLHSIRSLGLLRFTVGLSTNSMYCVWLWPLYTQQASTCSSFNEHLPIQGARTHRNSLPPLHTLQISPAWSAAHQISMLYTLLPNLQSIKSQRRNRPEFTLGCCCSTRQRGMLSNTGMSYVSRMCADACAVLVLHVIRFSDCYSCAIFLLPLAR